MPIPGLSDVLWVGKLTPVLFLLSETAHMPLVLIAPEGFVTINADEGRGLAPT